MAKLILFVLIFIVVSQFSDSANIRFENGRQEPYSYNLEIQGSSEGDLVYSDISSKHQEARDRLYRQLRQYGVPSDVAQMYVPRGMTIGEFMDKNKDNKPQHSSGDDVDDETESTFDPWSIVWYIGSFGGLIAFFLVISCSEWCCLKSRSAATLAAATAGSSSPTGQPRSTRCPLSTVRNTQLSCETPPPGYHLFAPPSYDDTITIDGKSEKNHFDVYVVPVHSVSHLNGGCLEGVPPPQYTEIVLTHT